MVLSVTMSVRREGHIGGKRKRKRGQIGAKDVRCMVINTICSV